MESTQTPVAQIEVGESAERGRLNEHVEVISIDIEGERRLWKAVLVQAVQEWQSSNTRARLAAEKFLMENDEDFEMVCAGAGFDPKVFRSQLARIARKSTPTVNIQLAA